MWKSTAWEEFDLLCKGHRSFQQKVMTHVPYILIFQSVQEKGNLVQHTLSFHHFLARSLYLWISLQKEVQQPRWGKLLNVNKGSKAGQEESGLSAPCVYERDRFHPNTQIDPLSLLHLRNSCHLVSLEWHCGPDGRASNSRWQITNFRHLTLGWILCVYIIYKKGTWIFTHTVKTE